MTELAERTLNTEARSHGDGGENELTRRVGCHRDAGLRPALECAIDCEHKSPSLIRDSCSLSLAHSPALRAARWRGGRYSVFDTRFSTLGTVSFVVLWPQNPNS